RHLVQALRAAERPRRSDARIFILGGRSPRAHRSRRLREFHAVWGVALLRSHATDCVWCYGNTRRPKAMPRHMLNPTLTPAKRCSPANSEERRDAGCESLQGALPG